MADTLPINILKQGAEGRLYLGAYNGISCLIKERFVKKYRHPDLDAQITRQRMKAETKAMARLSSAGIRVPRLFHIDVIERKIYMEYFGQAITAKEYIIRLSTDRGNSNSKSMLEKLCARIGDTIGSMHKSNIIHGDLTTSNILINPKEPKRFDVYDLVFIDFGLSHYSDAPEYKGVDLYVLERALLSTHSQKPFLFNAILEAYRSACGNAEAAIVAKFEEVRARGRKRTMVG